MSKKGVSAEEKKTRMLELFYEKGECFQLKELEKLAPKAKGIVANSVKDVVHKLVEDGLIETEKIGTSIYFWAFPSKAIKSKKRMLDDASKKYDYTTKKLKFMEQRVGESKVNKDDEKERNEVLNEVTGLELDVDSFKKTLQELQENDPSKFDEMIKKTAALKDATNRWTDNIFTVKSWCKKKFLAEDKDLDKQFGIPADFDYVE